VVNVDKVERMIEVAIIDCEGRIFSQEEPVAVPPLNAGG
jgi:hypothetical protein